MFVWKPAGNKPSDIVSVTVEWEWLREDTILTSFKQYHHGEYHKWSLGTLQPQGYASASVTQRLLPEIKCCRVAASFYENCSTPQCP